VRKKNKKCFKGMRASNFVGRASGVERRKMRANASSARHHWLPNYETFSKLLKIGKKFNF